ncbi:MAG: tRNA (adenosine(37)-N6)-threonylcarbamoyltransferase complex transferase subunit TsaD, partial [Gammaproteobacteria bacterium]|nr:tRNA (adenosine(37)-N6)-threonylcarbamoyltransferase complex transferase subunit TsaD [Gammaproteobacteria bacterium]
FEQAAVDTLRIKCQRGLQQSGHKQLVVAGGVSANQVLRDSLQSMVVKNQAKVFFPRLEFSTDNGAMIAFAGYLRLARGESSDLSFKAKPRWSLQDLT